MQSATYNNYAYYNVVWESYSSIGSILFLLGPNNLTEVRTLDVDERVANLFPSLLISLLNSV